MGTAQLRGFWRAKHWLWRDTSALSSVASPRKHRMHKLCSIGLPGPVRPGLANWLCPELWLALRSQCLETRCGLRAASPSRGVLVDFRADIWLPSVPEFYSLSGAVATNPLPRLARPAKADVHNPWKRWIIRKIFRNRARIVGCWFLVGASTSKQTFYFDDGPFSVAILAQSCSGSVSAVPALSELFQLCVATMAGSSSAAAAASEAWDAELHGPAGLHGEYLFIPYDALEAPSGRMSKREPSEKTVLKAVNDRRSRGSQQSFTWPQKGSQVTQPPTVCLSEVANSVRGGGGVGSQPRTSLTAGGWAPPLVPPSERFIRLFARPKDPPDSGHDVSLSVVGMQGPGAGARLQFG